MTLAPDRKTLQVGSFSTCSSGRDESGSWWSSRSIRQTRQLSSPGRGWQARCCSKRSPMRQNNCNKFCVYSDCVEWMTRYYWALTMPALQHFVDLEKERWNLPLMWHYAWNVFHKWWETENVYMNNIGWGITPSGVMTMSIKGWLRVWSVRVCQSYDVNRGCIFSCVQPF